MNKNDIDIDLEKQAKELVSEMNAIGAEELNALKNVPATIIDDEFFQNKTYRLDNASETESQDVFTQSNTAGMKRTSFYNPETLKNNHWLHYWGIKSTSPFKQAVVFTKDTVGVTSVTVSPATATVSAGMPVQLEATVVTTGFANKAVVWSVDSTSAEAGVKVNQSGKVTIPSTLESATEITVTATSVYDNTKSNTAVITIA